MNTPDVIRLDPHIVVGPVRRRLFGSFIEHLGRAVYDGIYEPGHPTADENGFRTDVMELVRELGISTVRYPGGNFVSGYRWEDGVGPRAERPVRRDLAWHSLETNQVGLDEFAAWCEATGTEMMLAVNLGTRGIQEALDLLEYTNGSAGTALADQRITNGSPEAHNVRMWCLGNEMDGPWQIGAMTAQEYGVLAARTARAMRMADPGLELVVCGSSDSNMSTFGSWEREVLEQTYDDVDYISCHAYYEEFDGDLASFLASSVDLDQFIETVQSTADHVKRVKNSKKEMMLSVDEWNVWYHQPHIDAEELIVAADTDGKRDWPYAPRLFEDVYSVADAVVVGSLLITLLRHSDRVTSASLAQLVNVIAPITTEPGGKVWRQTTFFPFALTSRNASGKVLRTEVETNSYSTKQHGEAPLVDSVATWNAEEGKLTLFLVNRSIHSSRSVRVPVHGFPVSRIVEATGIWDEDPYAQNTLNDSERVVPRVNDSVRIADGVLSVELPPVSWTMLVVD